MRVRTVFLRKVRFCDVFAEICNLQLILDEIYSLLFCITLQSFDVSKCIQKHISPVIFNILHMVWVFEQISHRGRKTLFFFLSLTNHSKTMNEPFTSRSKTLSNRCKCESVQVKKLARFLRASQDCDI